METREIVNQFDYAETVAYLLHWYDYNRRILPWRENPKPYYVWVSEIMLQQTRVEAVRGFFERFVDKLPSIRDLAEVDDDTLMKLWEGLGYYNRARNLKKAAELVVMRYHGELPANYLKLLELPGIGSYTAGAISSIAFGLPYPAVDGNVLRVMKRLSGNYDDITKDKVKKELEKELYQIMPVDRPGDYNQSLMELGATICLPNGEPLCKKCPVLHLCKAFYFGIQRELPIKSSKKARKIEDKTIFILEYEGKYAVHRRNPQGLLAGLWEFPNIPELYSFDKIDEFLQSQKIQVYEVEKLIPSKHIFSHIEWHMLGYYMRLKERIIEPFEDLVWVSSLELQREYPVPTAFTAYRKYIFDDKLRKDEVEENDGH